MGRTGSDSDGRTNPALSARCGPSQEPQPPQKLARVRSDLSDFSLPFFFSIPTGLSICEDTPRAGLDVDSFEEDEDIANRPRPARLSRLLATAKRQAEKSVAHTDRGRRRYTDSPQIRCDKCEASSAGRDNQKGCIDYGLAVFFLALLPPSLRLQQERGIPTSATASPPREHLSQGPRHPVGSHPTRIAALHVESCIPIPPPLPLD